MSAIKKLAAAVFRYGQLQLQVANSKSYSVWNKLVGWPVSTIRGTPCNSFNRALPASTHFGGSNLVASLNPVPGSRNFSGIFSKLCKNTNFWTPLRESRAGMASLKYMHRMGPHIKKRPPRKPLDGNPQMKGVVVKTLVRKPKKPNSANRKCVLVKLTNGKERVAYVPGIGHNLQVFDLETVSRYRREHNIVLLRVGRLRDTPGVKIKCVRGKYDLPHVQKQK